MALSPGPTERPLLWEQGGAECFYLVVRFRQKYSLEKGAALISK
jgi:hypothetical protein